MNIQPQLERRRRLSLLLEDDAVMNALYADWCELPSPKPPFTDYVATRIRIRKSA